MWVCSRAYLPGSLLRVCSFLCVHRACALEEIAGPYLPSEASGGGPPGRQHPPLHVWTAWLSGCGAGQNERRGSRPRVRGPPACVWLSGIRGSERVGTCVWLCVQPGGCPEVSDGQDKGLRRQTGGVGGRPALGVPRRASGSATGQRTGVGRGRARWGGISGFPYPRLVLTLLGSGGEARTAETPQPRPEAKGRIVSHTR